ncbi:hypothetical protein DXG03_006765 [Asterophora parasitica]|uniref:MYND-type domain-containing protein n=1 Tax=Asterophora parasitica TaxID=117018 RepID=A0A9P7FZF0_9AGAR|nr:hypothetical protein DXG03_006765 [Asterophora parasitica]
MRESNFAFPTQNKACVCITSQLYDRRALDTSSALPLLNSLTHLTYLTSTSPRIREIMTMDGGLERLVRLLHDFCISPPPPENGAVLYGLIPPALSPPKPKPTLNPPTFDKQAAYRFSLAFQCVVNIGVRGSEPIRSRVVQAGTLEVVGCILEAWLAGKGFAVGPSASATGMPRETREQRQARREAHLVMRQREQAAELERQRGPRPPTLRLPEEYEIPTSTASLHDALLLLSASTPITPGSDSELSTDASPAVTPIGNGTPTNIVVRDRSGTVIARDRGRRTSAAQEQEDSPTSSRAETETEEEEEVVDADGDVSMAGPSAPRPRRRGTVVAPRPQMPVASGSNSASTSSNHAQAHDSDTASPSVSPERRPSHSRHPVGIVTTDDADPHIIINDSVGGVSVSVGGVGVDAGMGTLGGTGGLGGMGMNMGGVEDGIVSLDANDDFAMGAPPGAPGAMDAGVALPGAGAFPGTRGRPGALGLGVESDVEGVSGGEEGDTSRDTSVDGRDSERSRSVSTLRRGPDETPRPGVIGLPLLSDPTVVPPVRPAGPGPLNQSVNQARVQQASVLAQGQGQARAAAAVGPSQAPTAGPTATAPNPTPTPPPTAATQTQPAQTQPHRHRHHHHSSHANGHSHHHEVPGPYRDEDVLLSLQLLAYLSKYPHVRQAFYKPRVTFHPASVDVVGGRWGQREGKEREREVVLPSSAVGRGKEREKETQQGSGGLGFLRSLGVGTRGSKASATASPSRNADPSSSSTSNASASSASTAKDAPKRQTNVFSLVERFTFKPSSTETDLPNPPPRLPPEIQYWAGVVMRNACRKDESRGGIRQCANMLCGRWEAYPRQFAKCRRCRKAKYCGKECQSIAWSEGHRFWCSAKDDDDAAAAAAAAVAGGGADSAAAGSTGAAADASAARRERRERERARERERERERMLLGAANATTAIGDGLRGPGVGAPAPIPTPTTTATRPVHTAATRVAEPWPDQRAAQRMNARAFHDLVPPPRTTHHEHPQQQLQPQPHRHPHPHPNPIGTGAPRPPRDVREPRGPASGFIPYDPLADPNVGVRRRAETVTGAIAPGVGVGLDGRMSAAHYPHGPGHGRMPHPHVAYFVPQGTVPGQQSAFVTGGGAGPSRRRRAEGVGHSPQAPALRSPVEENDMVLG